MTFEKLQRLRLSNWCQDGENRVEDPPQGIAFIEKTGLCTLYPTSPEFPNLLHAHTSDPSYKPEMSWDSVSGQIYTWRWKIGKQDAAFYAALVGKKPTWVAWPQLPTVLAAVVERRTPDELFDMGLVSQQAHRIATVLDEAGGILSTKDLRARAGFPTGKENRRAYLKAIEELEGHVLLAKKMAEGEGDDDMSHALIPTYYREQTDQALAITQKDALRGIVEGYLEIAAYINPDPFARALRVSKPTLLEILNEMASHDMLRTLPSEKATLYYLSHLEN